MNRTRRDPGGPVQIWHALAHSGLRNLALGSPADTYACHVCVSVVSVASRSHILTQVCTAFSDNARPIFVIKSHAASPILTAHPLAVGMDLTELSIAPPTPAAAPELAPHAPAAPTPTTDTTDNGGSAGNLTGSELPTHTLDELEYINNPPPRYTLRELAKRILLLAYLEESMHPNLSRVVLASSLTDQTMKGAGGPASVCIACLQMAIGGKTLVSLTVKYHFSWLLSTETPCPHGAFPEDLRARPLLVWPACMPYRDYIYRNAVGRPSPFSSTHFSYFPLPIPQPLGSTTGFHEHASGRDYAAPALTCGRAHTSPLTSDKCSTSSSKTSVESWIPIDPIATTTTRTPTPTYAAVASPHHPVQTGIVPASRTTIASRLAAQRSWTPTSSVPSTGVIAPDVPPGLPARGRPSAATPASTLPMVSPSYVAHIDPYKLPFRLWYVSGRPYRRCIVLPVSLFYLLANVYFLIENIGPPTSGKFSTSPAA